MKTFVLLLIPLLAVAGELTSEETSAFLKSEGCEFGAFRVYIGKPIAILKKGTVNTRAVCIASYESKGAKKIKTCMSRVIDLGNGRFLGDVSLGSSKRADNTICTKEVLEKMYKKSSYPWGEVQTDTKKWQWTVGPDTLRFSDYFLKITNGSN